MAATRPEIHVVGGVSFNYGVQRTHNPVAAGRSIAAVSQLEFEVLIGYHGAVLASGTTRAVRFAVSEKCH